MRNDNTNPRPGTRGAGRPFNAAGRRPAARGRYSAAEGSVDGSAAEGSAKRSYRSSGNGGHFGGKPSGRKPFGDRKPFGHRNSGEKSFGAKSFGDRKPFGRKPSGEKSYGEKPYGERSFDKRSSGERTFGRRPQGERDFERRPQGERSFGKKPFGERPSDRKPMDSRGFGKRNAEERNERPYATAYTPQQRKPGVSANEGIRLNKFIANSGICSRREADDYISAGLVSVNDVIITELGTRVYPDDVVKFNNERVKGEEKVYIVMNKPKDFVTTMSDPHAEKTVMNLVEGKCAQRVYPVGRLDKATTGVLLLTNDGDLAERLTHPSFEKKKIYHVFLDKNFKGPDFQKALDGFELEDGFVQADALSYIDEDKTQVGIEIHSGRNRIVRRIFEHLGYKIKKLDRVYFAGLTKKNLRRGQWRFLTEQEVAMLKMGSFE